MKRGEVSFSVACKMFSKRAKDLNQSAVDSDTLSDSSSINLDSENEDAFEMPKIRTADIDNAGDRSFRSMVGHFI